MSLRPSVEQGASEFMIGGITSLLGKSYAVATASMADVPYENNGLISTQNTSQKKSKESSKRPGRSRLILATLRHAIIRQMAMMLFSNQYRNKYHRIVQSKAISKLTIYTIEQFPRHLMLCSFSVVAQCCIRPTPLLQSIIDASACSNTIVELINNAMPTSISITCLSLSLK